MFEAWYMFSEILLQFSLQEEALGGKEVEAGSNGVDQGDSPEGC